MSERFTGGFVQTNGYLVATPDGSHLMIDAPLGAAAWLRDRGIVPAALLLTHQHYDHVEDAAAIAAMGAKVFAWSPYSGALTLAEMMRSFGMPVEVVPYPVDEILEGRAALELGGARVALLHVPGHAPDSVAFHFAEAGELYSGDALFAGSIGRTDLPGGDHAVLIAAIREKLYPLRPETRVFPGHGPATDIGVERETNPFIRP